MNRTLYRVLTAVAAPLIGAYLTRRKAAGKEDVARFGERLGWASQRRPNGLVVWIHAASVGEATSVLALSERLLSERPSLNILITTGTVTSAQILAERLPERALHHYVPVDRMRYVRRFLDHWKPDLALWVESEFWPNLISETALRGVPLVLLNGRMSQASFRRWQWARHLIDSLLGDFSLCLAQSEEEAGRLRSLGAITVRVAGNLKFAGAPLPADQTALDTLNTALQGRPRWLAASTHEGEDQIIAAAHDILKIRHPGLLTLIVPRHPHRGAAIAEAISTPERHIARRGAGEPPRADTDIYIADSMGELGLFFRLCGVVFMGGSLVPHGGHNPLEPALLDSAILFGPYMHNFSTIAAHFIDQGGAEAIADLETLCSTVDRLLSDDAERQRRSHAAHAAAVGEAAVLDRVVAELNPFLDALGRVGSEHASA